MNSSRDNGCSLIAAVLLLVCGAMAGVVGLACGGLFYLKVRQEAVYRKIENELKAYQQRSNAAISADLAPHGLTAYGKPEESWEDQEVIFTGKALDGNQVEHSYQLSYRTQGIGAKQTFERLSLEVDGKPIESGVEIRP